MVQFRVFDVRNLSRSRDCAWTWCCQLKHRLEHSNCPIDPWKLTKMPRKKHAIKAKNKNIQNARNARVQRSQGEFCQPLRAPALIPTAAFAYLKFKDKAIIPTDMPLQSAVEECESGQGEEKTDSEELDDGLEIVEQSELDHFNAILQTAQRLAAESEKKAPKRPKRYDGKSKKTLKRHKKVRENHAKQGYLSVFEFIAYAKEKAKKREQLMARAAQARAIEIEQESEESAPEDGEEVDTEDLVSERVGQVRCRKVLMC
jgi:hypothetical protein